MLAIKSKIKSAFEALCGAQGSLSGALLSAAAAVLSKPLGYLRVLLLAWLFGASAAMDAYYAASGILMLLYTLVQNVAESALLPRLVRQSGEDASSLMAWILRGLAVILAALVPLGLLYAPSIAKVFLRHFDGGRLALTASAFRLLIPCTVANLLLSLLSVWNNYRGRYSLVTVLICSMNLVLIPAVYGLSFVMGSSAVPVAYSLTYGILTAIIWKATGDFPCKVTVPPERHVLQGLRRDCGLCLGIVGAGSLYQLVDRYFASALPVGNISAINYAGVVYMLPFGVLSPALMIFLGKISRMAADGQDSRPSLAAALSMGWLYLFPPSAVLVCLAGPAVAVSLGYGAFDSRAVALTAPCVAAAAWALPLLLWGQILSRYAQAVGRLKTILAISYGALALNGLLDWLLAPLWGAPGLCVATGVTWGGSALLYLRFLTPGLLGPVIGAVWKPTALFGLLCAALLAPMASRLWPSLAAGAALLALYFLAGERLGFFSPIPGAWRPLPILRLIGRRLGLSA